MLHRAHLTKVRLSRMLQDVDPTCNGCYQAAATHIHMFGPGPVLTTNCQNISVSLSEATGKRLMPDTITALFGVTELKLFIAFVSLRWVRDALYFTKLDVFNCK
ncbi:hypothetical protein CHARACLAT_016740 [Characodon lateralis]|uniref:Uncharacterized protein n=1 Tax=Characodon lateralis TaxID=208331 RepID=A0ABU7EU99_9TELE|nr:hypothetical protein [Characodon lateralis]